VLDVLACSVSQPAVGLSTSLKVEGGEGKQEDVMEEYAIEQRVECASPALALGAAKCELSMSEETSDDTLFSFLARKSKLQKAVLRSPWTFYQIGLGVFPRLALLHLLSILDMLLARTLHFCSASTTLGDTINYIISHTGIHFTAILLGAV